MRLLVLSSVCLAMVALCGLLPSTAEAKAVSAASASDDDDGQLYSPEAAEE